MPAVTYQVPPSPAEELGRLTEELRTLVARFRTEPGGDGRARGAAPAVRVTRAAARV